MKNYLTRSEIIALHNECMETCVRVSTRKAGGSGTVIYSELIPKSKNRFETYVLTNHHVIESAITIRERYESSLGKNVDEELRKTVQVEFFEYENYSAHIGTTSMKADIVAWNEPQDLALLRLRSKNKIRPVAKLIPSNEIENVLRLDECVAIGAALGEPPLMTRGDISAMSREIDNYDYWASTAQIIYGNSGGAVFLLRSKEFIGVPSRVSLARSGFSAAPITHMGFFIPIERIYEWLESQHYHFIWQEDVDSAMCEQLREEERDREEAILIAQASRKAKKRQH